MSSFDMCLLLPSITDEGRVVTRIGVRDLILEDPVLEEKGKERLEWAVLPGRSRLGKGVVGRGVLAEDLGGLRVGKEDRRLTV